ncbi:MAG: arginine deiminase family protein, partial [Trebonia sp.]
MFHVDSEVGRLRQVILHRPDLELKRLTPDNVAGLLFDDMLWVSQAQAEHDAFAEALRSR